MLTHWGRVTPYGVGKFNTVSDSRSGFLMSRASFQVPTCLWFDQWLLKWLVMQTAAASSAAAVCITRRFSNHWPRFPKFTRPQWVNTAAKSSFLIPIMHYKARQHAKLHIRGFLVNCTYPLTVQLVSTHCIASVIVADVPATKVLGHIHVCSWLRFDYFLDFHSTSKVNEALGQWFNFWETTLYVFPWVSFCWLHVLL